MALPVKKLLNMTMLLCALLPFLMGQEHLNPIVTFAYLSLLPVAFLIDQSRLPRPHRWLLNIAVLLFLAAVFARIRFDYIVESFMESILVMIGAKMLEEKKARDYAEFFLLCLITLAAYGMLSSGKVFIVYCLGMALLSCFGLILTSCLSRDPQMTLPSLGARQLLTTALRILLMMLPIALLLFFITPRTQTPLSGSRIAASAKSSSVGFSDQVRLGDVASIQRSSSLVFRVLMDANLVGTPYWRGMVMDVFQGDLWTGSRLTAREAPFIIDTTREPIVQDIFMEPVYHRYFFALDTPIAIDGVNVVAEGGAVFKNPTAYTGKRQRYTARSMRSRVMRPETQRIPRHRFLSLPPGFSPRLQNTVDSMTAGMNEGEKIQAIMAFLSPPDFQYSLENLPVASNALEQFIFTAKKGNCEYFASAMGVMLRMAGIPSRLVAGYMGGYYSEAGGYYIVNQENAHVWVEAWDEKLGGWVRYDPTPVVEGTFDGGEYGTVALYWDLMDYHWNRLVANYDQDTQREFLQTLKKIVRSPRDSAFSPRALLKKLQEMRTRENAGIAALVLFCLGGAFLLRQRGRRSDEQILLRRFVRAMRRHGYTKELGEGLEEFCARVDNARLRDKAAQFATAFDEVYFRDKPIDKETHAALTRIIGEIRRFREKAASPK